MSRSLRKAPGLTRYVAEFIVNTKYEDIPENVVTLGKKTLLDGFGLALAGSAAAAGPIIRQYIGTLGLPPAKSATVIGTTMKVPPRFSALANGVSIHADDYDDTGSSLHVTGPVLPPAFALCEVGRRSGRDLMLAFHVGVEVASKIGDAIFPATIAKGFTRPAPSARSAAPRHARSFADSAWRKRPTRSGSPRHRPAAYGATSAR